MPSNTVHEGREPLAGEEVDVTRSFELVVGRGADLMLEDAHHYYSRPILDLMTDLERKLPPEAPGLSEYLDEQGRLEDTGGAVDSLYAEFRQNYHIYVKRERPGYNERKNAIHLAREALIAAAREEMSEGHGEEDLGTLLVGAYTRVLNRLEGFTRSMHPAELSSNAYAVAGSGLVTDLIRSSNLLGDFRLKALGADTASTQGIADWTAARVERTGNTTLQEMLDDLVDARRAVDSKLHPEFTKIEQVADSLNPLKDFPDDGLMLVEEGACSLGVEVSEQAFKNLATAYWGYRSADANTRMAIRDSKRGEKAWSRVDDVLRASPKALWDKAIFYGELGESYARWVAKKEGAGQKSSVS